VRCEPTWLERLIAPFNQLSVSSEQLLGRGQSPNHPIVQSPTVVAGFFQSDPHTIFELALGATVLPEVRDVNPQTFLPSSRSVAFRQSAWAAVGGYPEWLDFCEDVVFDLKLRPQFGPFVFAPEAVVHFRPRSNWRAFAKQYYQYARGDGKANLFIKQHLVRYFTYLVAAPLLVSAALTVSPWLWGLGLVAGLAYIRLPVRRLWPHLAQRSGLERLYALALIPLIRLIGDGAKMMGYPVGVWWRWRR
jgi:hypothetical protein